MKFYDETVKQVTVTSDPSTVFNTQSETICSETNDTETKRHIEAGGSGEIVL